jgi:hypothetical protein
MERQSPRWVRFNLRQLLFVVTLTACWLGWQVKIVQNRKAFRLSMESQAVEFTSGPEWEAKAIYWRLPDSRGDFHVSYVRRLLGDEGMVIVFFPRSLDSDNAQRLAELFPEAWIRPSAQR